jgi:hypothetical protein
MVREYTRESGNKRKPEEIELELVFITSSLP